jgi:hypothetical protein
VQQQHHHLLLLLWCLPPPADLEALMIAIFFKNMPVYVFH